MITFTIPGEPVPKGRPRVVQGRTYTPAKTKSAERAIWAAARQAKVKPLTGMIAVMVKFYLGNKRRVDLDNLVKTVLDGLNTVAWTDDSQVCYIEALKEVSPDPRTIITVWSYL